MEPSELTSVDLLLQFSEESGELVQAISKLIRKERGNNPTPLSREECLEKLVDEMADTMVVLSTLMDHWGVPLEDVNRIAQSKRARWSERLNQ